ncbi:MAG: hypothetical protein GXO89_02040 [Chlorobi bacterium]|nr:hypothetical protein [Chlorobiota bacterium]
MKTDKTKISTLLLMTIILSFFTLQGNAQCTNCDGATTANGGSAIGYQTNATGSYSFASGYQSAAPGNESTAIGYKALSHQPWSVALGFFAEAHNNNSFCCCKK